MKFGKEFACQLVQEWREAYMDYSSLKQILKDILNFQRNQTTATSSAVSVKNTKASLKRRLSLYRAFSGLTNQYNNLVNSPRKSTRDNEDEVILVSAVQNENSDGYYQTMFLMAPEQGGDNEVMFFRRLDNEFNKVLQFYKTKVEEVEKEAEELSRQMDALIAFRIKVDKPRPVVELEAAGTGIKVESSDSANVSPNKTNKGRLHMDTIQEVEMNGGENAEDESRRSKESEGKSKGSVVAQLKVLDHIRVNVEPESPVSTLKNIFKSSPDLSFSKVGLKKAEEKMKQALIEFHGKLRLLKSYSFLNLLAFSKIMKKYDKITSRHASKSYLEMVDKSYLGSSDEVNRLTERVEKTFINHFCNGNRRHGMKFLRPQAKKEKHRITFFLGLFAGCSLALIISLIISIYARDILKNPGKEQYMNNVFPLYSLFGYIVLHMLMYAGNIYLWRRVRANYPFIFGFKQGTELGYREVLLLASGLSVLALAAVLSNLDMDMDPITKQFQTLTELVPLGLVTVLLLILFCPFNIIYRSSRFFLIRCAWHCLCAPLYKVTFPDFFLADQLTSQVQALRSLQFYICYYGWGDFKRRSNNCQGSDIYKILYIIVAVVPYWSRFLQCIRRLVSERESKQGLNALKYLSTIVALVARTIYDQNRGTTWKIIAAATSGITTVYSTYWDIVIDWGLLRRDSRNRWLRDKLLLSNKLVYFVAMVVNVILRLVWMQLVLDFQAPFLHRRAMVAVVASLEILRRGIWNFFRMENEHLNNVENYRAFKSVPLPFYYD
ncbi:hypothetical protein M9H77_15519 [Catharanthus roseus]|uniref:Uncharacterized protein n=1 Tax=Catharanthus roseus TaxID=4058 RepID=A0ACC0AY30_CATRO|nr:hypothetical protein M9H77_15519 [Catharanthus roseus]